MHPSRTSPLESGYFIHCKGQRANIFTTEGIYAVLAYFKSIWKLSEHGSGISVAIVEYPMKEN